MVVAVATRSERSTADRLRERLASVSCTVLVPELPGRKMKPRFPGYILLECSDITDEIRRIVQATAGVRSILAGEVDSLLEIGEAAAKDFPLRPGDIAIVRIGIFKDRFGVLKELNRKTGSCKITTPEGMTFETSLSNLRKVA